MKKLVLLLSLVGLVACDNNGDNAAASTNGPIIDCSKEFDTTEEESLAELATSTNDPRERRVTMMSSENFGYDNSAYNLYGNCFSHRGNGCKENDQMLFEHGGGEKHLSVGSGEIIYLDKESQEKFDEINFAKLDELKLKTANGVEVSRDTIFGNPNKKRPLALHGKNDISDYEVGTAFLVLLDDTRLNDDYALYKMKVEKIIPGERVGLLYQRVAEVPKRALRNYHCTNQTRLKKQNTDFGTATIYTRDYAGYRASTFGLDYGVNGHEGRIVDSQRIGSFHIKACEKNKEAYCVNPNIGSVDDEWGGVLETNEGFEEVDMESWPSLQTIDPKSARSSMELGKTYLVSRLASSNFAFGAIKIVEMDPEGNWVIINWKRVGIVPPYKFMEYTEVPIENNVSGWASLGDRWNVDSHFDVAFGQKETEAEVRTESFYFDAKNNEISIDNRYFPKTSGIVDITSNTKELSSFNADSVGNYDGKYKRSLPVKAGKSYLVVYENFWFRSVMVVKVTANKKRKSMDFKYRRIYNGQTIPGQWDDN